MRIAEAFPREVREIETVWIEMPDGCRLAARIWLPDDAEQSPVPAILEPMQPLLGPDTTVVWAVNGVPWWYFHELDGPYRDHRLR